MFDQLVIDESEFDDFIIEEEQESLEASTRWMVVARVLCGKKFSHDALMQQMQIAWNPAREVTMRPVGANLFLIQCFCLGDWEKVMERGPWLFREWMMITAPYDGFSDLELVELEHALMWIQVHKVPEGFRKIEVLKPLINRACGYVETLELKHAGIFRGDFVRARIRVDVQRPLARFVSLSRGGKIFLYVVKYEKLGMICFTCGLIGHDYKECGAGVFDEKDLKYGEWIYVNPPSSRGRDLGGLRGGFRGGHGGLGFGECASTGGMEGAGRGLGMVFAGRGHGTFVDWREHPERHAKQPGVGDRELMDTATSPNKVADVHMSDVEKNAKNGCLSRKSKLLLTRTLTLVLLF
jgi:hypothetical protein